RKGEGLSGALGGMDAAEGFELFGNEALRPHREPVDAGLRPGLEQRPAHRFRVGLERDLRAFGDRKAGCERPPHTAEVPGGERRGRAATEEDRSESERARRLSAPRDLALD